MRCMRARARRARTLRPAARRRRSESTPEGRRVTKLDTILLNGNNIAVVRACARPARARITLSPSASAAQLVPGGAPDESAQ